MRVSRPGQKKTAGMYELWPQPGNQIHNPEAKSTARKPNPQPGNRILRRVTRGQVGAKKTAGMYELWPQPGDEIDGEMRFLKAYSFAAWQVWHQSQCVEHPL